MLMLDARTIGINSTTLMRRCGISKQPDKIEPLVILETLPIIESALSDRSHGAEAIKDIMPSLKSASKLSFSEDELIRLCETWRRHPILKQSLFKSYVRVAATQYSENILFKFFKIEANTPANRTYSYGERYKLEGLLDRARDEGDSHTSALIEQALREHERFYSPEPSFMNFFNGYDESNDDEEDDEDDFESGLTPDHLIDALVDGMFAEGIPPDIKAAINQLSIEMGVDLDDRSLLKMLLQSN